MLGICLDLTQQMYPMVFYITWNRLFNIPFSTRSSRSKIITIIDATLAVKYLPGLRTERTFLRVWIRYHSFFKRWWQIEIYLFTNTIVIKAFESCHYCVVTSIRPIALLVQIETFYIIVYLFIISYLSIIQYVFVDFSSQYSNHSTNQ